MRSTVITLFLVILAGSYLFAQGSSTPAATGNTSGSFTLEQVASGLEHPWAITPIPDGRFLVTERPGRMHIFDGDRLHRISGVPSISTFGQGGLLDIAIHPDFADNQLIFFTFAERAGAGAGTAVARGTLDGTSLREVETIFSLEPKTQRRQHFGSRLAFLPDGTLLFTIGDRGWPDSAQDTRDHAGATLRINTDGTVPADNPFVDDPEYHPELFTIGNRNSQGMTIHPRTGEVWQSEHGPRGGDELNVIEPGKNYGWPVISHGVDYRTGEQIGRGTHAPGMEQPVTHWSPAIAPSGITFYFGDAFPQWDGNLFVASLVDRHLRRIELDGHTVVSQEVLLHNEIGRIRDVTVGHDGYIYLITDESNGGIYRLR